MTIPQILGAQRDFSSGELNPEGKRRDDAPEMRAGARQLRNWRILNPGAVRNRPGRTALFPTDGRTEEVLIAPGTVHTLCFGNGTLKIRDQTGALVAGNTGYAWTAATAGQIVFALVPRDALDRDIIMCFPGKRPKIARYTNGTGWSFLDFTFAQNANRATAEPFYRLAGPGITITPSDVKGTITVSASADVFVAAMVGARVRWLGNQILLVGFTDTKTMTGIVLQQLPPTFDYGGTFTGSFQVGDVVEDAAGRQGEVTAVGLSAGLINLITVNHYGNAASGFPAAEDVVGPNGVLHVTSAGSATSPKTTLQWDESACSDYRGWPQSVFFDQNRLGFCNLPSVPGAVLWSGIGIYDSFTPGALPSDAIFEIAPDRVQVLFVMPGPESSEFVFCDKAIYYIPISETNPLKPGSVAFKNLSKDGCANVQPQNMQEVILYVSSGGLRVQSIIAPGAYYRPYETRDLTDQHSHLFNAIVCIAIPNADGTFPERYAYVLNGDGTIAVGKYNVENGTIKGIVGWLPWDCVNTPASGAPASLTTSTVEWISALGSDVIMTTTYTSGATGVKIAEILDDGQYLDGSQFVNAVPPPMQTGTDPSLSTLLVGGAFTSMNDHAAPAAAFDGNPLKAQAGSPGVNSATAGYNNTIGAFWGTAHIVNRVRVTAPLDVALSGNGSTTFKIQGSHDGSTYTDLYTSAATLGTLGEVIDITTGITVTTAYEYHRINVSGTSTKEVGVAQVEFYSTTPGETHQSVGGGMGPLWWLAGGTADLIDGWKTMGTYQVDVNGNLVPIQPGEDLSSATLTAGKAWTATLEPFVHNMNEGQDVQQRMRRRRVPKIAATVYRSSGFVLAGLRVPPWNVGDDASQAPPLRESTFFSRPLGRDYDPRVNLIKDTPGPLTIVEIGIEAGV